MLPLAAWLGRERLSSPEPERQLGPPQLGDSLHSTRSSRVPYMERAREVYQQCGQGSVGGHVDGVEAFDRDEGEFGSQAFRPQIRTRPCPSQPAKLACSGVANYDLAHCWIYPRRALGRSPVHLAFSFDPSPVSWLGMVALSGLPLSLLLLTFTSPVLLANAAKPHNGCIHTGDEKEINRILDYGKPQSQKKSLRVHELTFGWRLFASLARRRTGDAGSLVLHGGLPDGRLAGDADRGGPEPVDGHQVSSRLTCARVSSVRTPLTACPVLARLAGVTARRAPTPRFRRW
jgi:hypothetical protein